MVNVLLVHEQDTGSVVFCTGSNILFLAYSADFWLLVFKKIESEFSNRVVIFF